jgi:protein TonB
MLRSTRRRLSPLALGFSVALHAAALLASTGRHGPPVSGRDEVSVDVTTDLAPVPDDPTVAPPVDPAAISAKDPYPVAPGHAARPAPRVDSPAPTADTAHDETPRFTLAIGAGAGHALGLVSSSGTARSRDPGDPAAGPSVDTPARLVGGPAPTYTEAARADGIEGDVHVELVVDPSGAVESARVVRGLGHGLDEAALHAAQQYRFVAATAGGRAVRVRMDWSVQFRLD